MAHPKKTLKADIEWETIWFTIKDDDGDAVKFTLIGAPSWLKYNMQRNDQDVMLRVEDTRFIEPGTLNLQFKLDDTSEEQGLRFKEQEIQKIGYSLFVQEANPLLLPEEPSASNTDPTNITETPAPSEATNTTKPEKTETTNTTKAEPSKGKDDKKKSKKELKEEAKRKKKEAEEPYEEPIVFIQQEEKPTPEAVVEDYMKNVT